MKTALNLFFGICIGLAFAGGLLLMWQSSAGAPIYLQATATIPSSMVQVSGAVSKPGVYALSRTARMQDAIEAAGGLLPEADTTAINLAAHVRDGEKLIIPARQSAQTTTSNSAPAAAPAAISPGTPSADHPLDLNSATAEQLDTLPGIGPTRAADILRYREAHGGFKRIEELKDVSGIGDVTFDHLKDLVYVP